MIRATDLTFSYDGASQTMRFPHIECKTEGKLLILGDSGSGKTTLLHLLCGLLRPKTGEIVVSGLGVNKLGDRELDQFRGRELGMVFQQAHFVQSLTVSENLALPSLLTKDNISSTDLANRTQELLTRLRLDHKSDALPRDLSVGEQQRASIARALIHKPSVVFADEPTSALDDRSTEAVIQLLEDETQLAGASLVVVTHDSRLKSRYSDRVELENMAQ
jgi:putative ABC transport system ATP-binding protein